MRKKRSWHLRFRWGYSKVYGWRRKKFAFGFLLGPLLFYKPNEVVYVKKYIDRDAILDVGIDLTKSAYEDAKAELFKSIPYDFGLISITSFTDYDIAYNRYGFLVEGVPKLAKEL